MLAASEIASLRGLLSHPAPGCAIGCGLVQALLESFDAVTAERDAARAALEQSPRDLAHYGFLVREEIPHLHQMLRQYHERHLALIEERDAARAALEQES